MQGTPNGHANGHTTTFGEVLRSLRQARGYSTRRVAKQAGCAQSRIEEVEAGKGPPLGAREVKRLSFMFGEINRYKDLPVSPPPPAPPPPPRMPARPYASDADRLAWAGKLWREDITIPINGDNGMIEQMLSQFGRAASLQALQNLRTNILAEHKRRQRDEARSTPLGATIAERLMPPPKAPPAAAVSQSPPAPAVEPPAEEPTRVERTADAAIARRVAFVKLVRKHPDLPLYKLQDMVKKETGGKIDHYAASKLWKEARAQAGVTGGRGTKPEAAMVGLTNKKQRRRADAESVGSYEPPPEQAPPPEPAPPATTRTSTTAEEQILAAVQLLREAVPGIHTLTIGDDGSIDYTMREMVVRSGKLKL